MKDWWAFYFRIAICWFRSWFDVFLEARLDWDNGLRWVGCLLEESEARLSPELFLEGLSDESIGNYYCIKGT